MFTPQLRRGGDPLSEVGGRFKRAPRATAEASQGEVGGLTPSARDPSLAPLICRRVRPILDRLRRRGVPTGRVSSGSWKISRGSGEEPVLRKIRGLRDTVPSVTEEGGGGNGLGVNTCCWVQSSSKILDSDTRTRSSAATNQERMKALFLRTNRTGPSTDPSSADDVESVSHDAGLASEPRLLTRNRRLLEICPTTGRRSQTRCSTSTLAQTGHPGWV